MPESSRVGLSHRKPLRKILGLPWEATQRLAETQITMLPKSGETVNWTQEAGCQEEPKPQSHRPAKGPEPAFPSLSTLNTGWPSCEQNTSCREARPIISPIRKRGQGWCRKDLMSKREMGDLSFLQPHRLGTTYTSTSR